jgi:hypothetical protein
MSPPDANLQVARLLNSEFSIQSLPAVNAFVNTETDESGGVPASIESPMTAVRFR